jgi:hypothetical protein
VSKQDFALADAKEMAAILTSAKCLVRYDKIAHELLSELLVAIATKGEVVGGNNRGSDVFSDEYQRVEVKSRILGTDGPFPRVSLRPSNLEKADNFVAVRWKADFTFYDAVMLPKSAVLKLHADKSQSNGMAHISWLDWKNNSQAVSFKEKCVEVLSGVHP